MYRPKRYTYVYFKTFCSQYRQMNKLQVLFIGGKILVNTTHVYSTFRDFASIPCILDNYMYSTPTYLQTKNTARLNTKYSLKPIKA